MLDKIAELLFKQTQWKLTFNQKSYTAQEIKVLLSGIIANIDVDLIQSDGYFIAVGFNAFEYILYIMLASVLGLKIILCDPKMLNTLLEYYQLHYVGIISSRKIDTKNIFFIKINFDDIPLVHRELSAPLLKQAELVFFTSGTTSTPKLVIYKERILLNNASVVGSYLDVKPGNKALCLFSTHYMYGFSTVFSMILYGGEVILERSTITAQEIWSYLVNDNIQFLPLIQSLVEKLKPLIEKEKGYFKDLTILNASDRIYQAHIKDILKICPTFRNNFGQTESGPRIFSIKMDASNVDDLGCYSYSGVVALGVPVDSSIKISILNEELEKCKMLEVGELHYQTPFCMEGYLGKQGQLIKKSWIGSGDLVYQNENGNVCWVGRKTETIKIDGRYANIGLLHQYFDVIDGVKKSYFTYDEQVGLLGFFIRDKRFTDTEIKNKILSLYKDRFPTYPRIKQLKSVKEIPITISGKVKYSCLMKHVTEFAEVQHV
jgi:acyl-coenzyme A synthetase/AMP-(fatty) acid ligase